MPAKPNTQLLQRRHQALSRADEEHFLARCMDIIDRWSPIMGLETWIINVRVGSTGELSEGDKASVFCYPEYRDAEISFNPRRLWPTDPVELEETIIHELGHVRTAEFFWLWKRARKVGGKQGKKLRGELEEAMVSDLTGTITRAYEAGVTGVVMRRK